MGLFSSKKKITVGSSMYNLAGDIDKRVQYLPTTINTKIIAGTAPSIGQTIQDSLIRGPGMRMRSYARWGRTSGYIDKIGMKQGKLSVGNNINLSDIIASIPHGPEEDVVVQTAEIDLADYGYWADQWMLNNHPDQISSNYEIDMDEELNEIYILFGGVVTYTFSPADFDPNGMYLYISYMIVKRNQVGTLFPGTETQVPDEASLPDTSDYIPTGSTSTPKSAALTDTILTEITYSDATPPSSSTTTVPHTDSYNDIEAVYEKVSFSGESVSGESLLSLRNVQTNFKRGYTKTTVTANTTNEDIGGGVIKTTKVTTTAETIDFNWFYRKDYQEIVISEWLPMQVIIYRQGTGNPTYDAMFLPDVDMGSFVPFIPLRRWGNFLGEDNFPTLYGWTTKAVKRSMDKDIEFINDQLRDNDSIGDIDFAYISYGVSLNTKEKAGLKYIYKFFQLVQGQGAGGAGEYSAWKTKWNEANDLQTHWATWKGAQSDPLNPLYGTPEPPQGIYPAQPLKQLKVYSDSTNYNMTVNWTGISEVTGVAGLGRPGAKVGDLWFIEGGQELFPEVLISKGKFDDRVIKSDMVTLYWQDKPNSFRAMGLRGLHHTNIVYKGKGVDIYGIDALNDPEESGFIIPLHEGVMKAMSLKDSTQLSTSCAYMILNYYEVTKQKWYTKSWFKVVLIVAVIVITIVTWGSAGPAGAGVLGAASAVGTAVGLAGTAAIIAGAAINAIAGMIVAQMIMKASVALFGPEVGAIVGAIASVAVLSMGTSLANGGTAMAGLQSMTSSVNLMQMTAAAGNGLSQAAQGKMAEINQDVLDLQNDYKTKMTEIYTAWSENLGFNKGTIDIQALTEAARVDHVYEDMDTFLSRTLWTGSDIAGITNDLIGNFTEASITNQLP